MTKKLTKADRERMTKRLEESPAYKTSFLDNDFIMEDIARPFRLQIELSKPEILLRREKINSTIVVFGGTRIVDQTAAEAQVRIATRKLKSHPNDPILKRGLRIAKSILAKSPYYEEAREFARLVSRENQRNADCEYVVVTGGGPGIMEAANRGAYECGAKSIGMNITLPFEQHPNPYITPELCFQFHYFAIRKMHFLLRAKALVAFPGGFGTMDELFEALTLIQTQKVTPLPVILFGEKFWRNVVNFEHFVEEGTISPEDVELFVYADKARDAWNYIKSYYEAHDADKD
jgi:hypothetical protein